MAEYIEREAAQGAIMKRKWAIGSDGAMAMEAISTIPVADVVPVMHAHWIKTFGSGGMLVGWKCSAPDCGVLSCYKGAYCPNCGAKMEGEEGKR